MMRILLYGYLAAAVGGLVTSGAAADLLRGPWFPGLDRTFGPAGWRGAWWLPGRLLTVLFMLQVACIATPGVLVLYLFTSPLWALKFFNDLTGRPPPHGRMARWYFRHIARWTGVPPTFPTPE